MNNHLHQLLVVSYELCLTLIFSLPRYSFFNWLKVKFLSLNGAKFGQRTTIYPGVWIAPGRNLSVGDDVDFALGVIVTTGGGVTIGNRVLIGYRAQILSTNHVIPNNKGKIFGSGHDKKPVFIADDVWIGANSIILPGVTIGEGAVIAAGSIVTKSVKPFSVVAGVPAKVIKHRE